MTKILHRGKNCNLYKDENHEELAAWAWVVLFNG
jgi:hypothetical protein